MREPFAADIVQIAQLINALSSDNLGNLIFTDKFIPNGVTLSELLNSGGSGSGSAKTYIQDVLEEHWTATSYTFDNENTYTGYECIINHNMNLTNKYDFVLNVYEIGNDRMIKLQDLIILDENNIKIFMDLPLQCVVVIKS